MTGVEGTEGAVAGVGRVGWRHVVGAVAVALAVALVGVAAVGGAAAQDQPGEPVNVYGEAEDELGNGIQVGTTIYAIVDGEVEDSFTVEEEGQFGGGDAFDDKLAVNDGAGGEVVFAVNSPDGVTALDTVNLDSAGEVVEINLTFPGGSFAGIDVNNNGLVATDTTANGLLNDVDGDGAFDIFDVQTLFENFNEPIVQNNASAFNFNGDDPPKVTIFDVQALFNTLAE
jgi:hypothetical protein